MEKFIYTKDKETAEKLTKAGFVVVKSGNDVFCFLNRGLLNFEVDCSKMFYSNKLMF